MIQAGKEAERKESKTYFSQSTVNSSLKDATVNNYQPQNEQVYASKNIHRIRQKHSR